MSLSSLPRPPLPRSIIALALAFAGLWLVVISEQTLFFSVSRSCWFYDANLGEHSFSEQLTLACYGVAALLCKTAQRQHSEAAYRWLLLIIIVCFLEEANYGQVFWSPESLFFDRDQLAWHTATTLDDTLHLEDGLSALLLVGLPSWWGRKHYSLAGWSQLGALAIPCALYTLLSLLVGDWSTLLSWHEGHFQCSPYPEELLETFLAASLVYGLLIDRLLIDRLLINRSQLNGEATPLPPRQDTP